METPRIEGFGHIDLTVTDKERSAQWWEQVMGFMLVAHTKKPGWDQLNLAHPSGLVVSVMTHDTRTSDRFDERSIGLDHLAFRVKDREALEAWVRHLDALNVPHSGIQEEQGGPLVVFRDPDNIQLELWAFDVERLVQSRLTPP
jgi:catechol 2,3-dioxygenase-like lactoylglutathione lyase family enzyme